MSKTTLLIISMLLISSSLVMGADSTFVVTPKSKRTALTSSLVGTFAPVVSGGGIMLLGIMQSDQNAGVVFVGAGFVTLGLILGPGAGHAYARNVARFWKGALLRGIALPAGGALAVYHGARVSSLKEFPMIGKIVVAVCGVTYLASTVNDIATVGRSVDKYNRSHTLVGIRIEPGYITKYKAPALIVSVHF
jgi:hypothetical protein